MTLENRYAYNVIRRTALFDELQLKREIALHARYRALRARGWSAVVWVEDGAYFIPNTPIPDFNDKTRITLDDFEQLITDAKTGIRKPIHGETLASPITASKTV